MTGITMATRGWTLLVPYLEAYLEWLVLCGKFGDYWNLSGTHYRIYIYFFLFFYFFFMNAAIQKIN